MTSLHHNDEIYKEKRKPKVEIKFNLKLNEEQKEAKSEILKNTISVVTGIAGTGKSALVSQIALDLLFKKEIEKIIVDRPLVTSGEELGFLPGGIKEKTDPLLYSIYDNMYRLYKKEYIDKLITEGKIEVCPFAFMRGRNFSNCMVIIDEAQNLTMSQTELVLGRLCYGSKMVLIGDNSQIDLKNKKDSGFSFLKNLKDIEGFCFINLKINHRHPIVEKVLSVYKEFQ